MSTGLWFLQSWIFTLPDLLCKNRYILANRHRGPRLRLEEACVFSEHLGFKGQGFEGKHTAAFSGWMSSRTGAVNEAPGLLSKLPDSYFRCQFHKGGGC